MPDDNGIPTWAEIFKMLDDHHRDHEAMRERFAIEDLIAETRIRADVARYRERHGIDGSPPKAREGFMRDLLDFLRGVL